jgi:hypothetical protein
MLRQKCSQDLADHLLTHRGNTLPDFIDTINITYSLTSGKPRYDHHNVDTIRMNMECDGSFNYFGKLPHLNLEHNVQ